MKWNRESILVLGTLTLVTIAVIIPKTNALSLSGVLITQVQTGSLTSASDEFIELYNTGASNVDVSTWRLEYFPASSTNFDNPSRKIPLHGVIGSHHYFLAASTNYLTNKANETFAATLAKTGGHVRLVSQAQDNAPILTQDLVGWGTAIHPGGSATSAPTESKSLLRKADATGNYLDSGNNSNDFQIADTPNPRSDPVLAPTLDEPQPNNPVPDPIPVEPTPDDSGLGTGSPGTPEPTSDPSVEVQPIVDVSQLSPVLSEVMPNPAAPASDDTDEFIELYNPNINSLSLAGYKLQTGNTFSYSYTFSHESLPGQSYVAFWVTQTGDVLANAGGKVRLIDPLGNIVDETSYTTAAEGHAWANIDGTWQWSTVPTPNAQNIVTSSVGTNAATKKAVTPKPKAAPKVSAAKAKVAPKKSAAKTSKKTSVSTGKYSQAPTTQIHPMILAVVTIAAVGYALYEYRDDLANRIYQFRRHREDRRTARQES